MKIVFASHGGPEWSMFGSLVAAVVSFAVQICPSRIDDWRHKRLLAVRERIERELSSLTQCSLKAEVHRRLGEPTLVLSTDGETQRDGPRARPVDGLTTSGVEQADCLEVYDRGGFRFHVGFRGDEKVSLTLEYVLTVWDQAVIRRHGAGRPTWWPNDVLPRFGDALARPPDTEEGNLTLP